MFHLIACFVILVIQGGAMAKFWPLHHILQSMYMGDGLAKIFTLTRPVPHELSKKVLSVFSLILSLYYIGKILSTTKLMYT